MVKFCGRGGGDFEALINERIEKKFGFVFSRNEGIPNRLLPIESVLRYSYG